MNQPTTAPCRPDAWKLYCEAFTVLWPNATRVSDMVSPAALQEMVDRLVAPPATDMVDHLKMLTSPLNACLHRLNCLATARTLANQSAAGNTLAADILAVCRLRRWNMNWTSRGVYLHLEASELIEALRGKRGDPLSEAADVLLVLMSITENAGMPWDTVMQRAREICEELKTRPRYAGEEYDRNV
jgi:hypothetical protein